VIVRVKKGMDLRERIDQATGHGPPLPSAERRLVAGRAALHRRRTRIATGAVGAVLVVVVPVAAWAWSPTSAPGHAGSATSPSGQATSSQPVDTPTTGGEGDTEFTVVVVDGVPQLAGQPAGLTIGPVVRGTESAFGLETRIEGERSFVLLLRGHHSWLVRRLVTAERGDDLASWLRAQGWLPTGEAS
jgi:hypothetical protein